MYPDINARPTAAVLLEDETTASRRRGPAQHPAASVINIAERTGVELRLHRLGRALEAKVLGGHQGFARPIARVDHPADIVGRRRQRLLAEHVLARLQRGDGQRRVIHIGSADIDDVDVGIAEQRLRVGMEFGHAMFCTEALKRLGPYIATGHQFGVCGSLPTGDMRACNAADADDTDFEFAHYIPSLDLLVCVA